MPRERPEDPDYALAPHIKGAQDREEFFDGSFSLFALLALEGAGGGEPRPDFAYAIETTGIILSEANIEVHRQRGTLAEWQAALARWKRMSRQERRAFERALREKVAHHEMREDVRDRMPPSN